MREEPIQPKSRQRKWIVRSLLYILVAFLALAAGGNIVLAELPIHLFLGWIFHALQAFPAAFSNWRGIFLPAACLLMAGVPAHRLIARWVGRIWKPMHTASAFGLLLLGCVAAISLSAVVHQFAWLSKDRWTIDQSRRAEWMVATSDARQLALLIYGYHVEHGHLPHSLAELSEQSLAWTRADSTGPPEPYLLLNPGGHLPHDPQQPIFVSPVIRSLWIIVGKADSTVQRMPAAALPDILENRRSPDYLPPAGHD